MRKSARRSLLFAPAHRPGLFAKAVAKGADIVCIECEDAVPAHKKAEARAEMISLLSARHPSEIPVMSGWCGLMRWILRRVRQICRQSAHMRLAPDAILLPKIDTAGQLSGVAGRLDAAGLVRADGADRNSFRA